MPKPKPRNWYPAASLVQLEKEINTRWPDRPRQSDGTIGDEAHSKRKSDHNPAPPEKNGKKVVKAKDFTVFDGVFDIIEAAQKDSRTKYIIYDDAIWYPGTGWVTYKGTNPHKTHVHISVHNDYDDPRSWGLLDKKENTSRMATLDKDDLESIGKIVDSAVAKHIRTVLGDASGKDKDPTHISIADVYRLIEDRLPER